jgi:hypothetical protein
MYKYSIYVVPVPIKINFSKILFAFLTCALKRATVPNAAHWFHHLKYHFSDPDLIHGRILVKDVKGIGRKNSSPILPYLLR